MSDPHASRPVEKLEVPIVTALDRRLTVEDGQRSLTKPAIGAVPPSALLSRLQGFLPELAAANSTLHGEQSVSMEAPEGADGPVVELDLACGLFDLNNQAAEQAAERSLTHGQATPNSEDDSSDDDEEESSSDEEGGAPERQEAEHAAAAGRSDGARRRKTVQRPKAGIEELS
ncbi:hypothetical protein ACKKBG_A00050 [Auxenochlorella protothecoides x Auxenochlorella symbiontica]